MVSPPRPDQRGNDRRPHPAQHGPPRPASRTPPTIRGRELYASVCTPAAPGLGRAWATCHVTTPLPQRYFISAKVAGPALIRSLHLAGPVHLRCTSSERYVR